MEDSLNLWMSALTHAPVLSTELIQLFPRLLSLLDITSEDLRFVLLIFESYIGFGSPELFDPKARNRY